MEIEAQYQWMKRGKKFKTKYFAALGQLFKDEKNAEEKSTTLPDRRSRTDQIRDLVGEE